MKFKEFLGIVDGTLNEALVTFGKKAYPKFGNIVILAGGAGSGKGFSLSNTIGIEGKVFDVDELKTMAMKLTDAKKLMKLSANKYSELGKNKVLASKVGKDISDLSLKNKGNVFMLHQIVKDLGIEDAKMGAIIKSVLSADPDRKPNLIFDVTMKNIGKLEEITKSAYEMGYDKKNIHIVWILNDINIAIDQNYSRKRVVPEDILIDTHGGALQTMTTLIKNSDKLRSYMDGDLHIIFARADIDSSQKYSQISKEDQMKTAEILKSAGVPTKSFEKWKPPFYLDKVFYVTVKEAGKTSKTLKELIAEIQRKMFNNLDQKHIEDTNKWLMALNKGYLSSDKETNDIIDIIKKYGI